MENFGHLIHNSKLPLLWLFIDNETPTKKTKNKQIFEIIKEIQHIRRHENRKPIIGSVWIDYDKFLIQSRTMGVFEPLPKYIL